jgi:para-nitrobenzyl esterase
MGSWAVRPITAFTAGRFAHVQVMIGATSMDIGGRKGPMVAGARDLAGLLASQGVPTYHYRFSYVAPAQVNPGAGAWHATDIPYFLGTLAIKYGERTVPQDLEMGNIITTYLAHFISASDPNGKDGTLPRWAPFDRKTSEVMDFTQQGTAVQAGEPWAP